jgi:hypothetical protein
MCLTLRYTDIRQLFFPLVTLAERALYNPSNRHTGEGDCVAIAKKKHLNRHTGGGRYPEVLNIPGFRVALRLHGMTKMVIATQSRRPVSRKHLIILDSGSRAL